MHHDVIVQLAGSDEITLHTTEPMTAEQASAWLDREFARLECVATRPSGKVLFVDKVLAIAEAADASGFADVAWADQLCPCRRRRATPAADPRGRAEYDRRVLVQPARSCRGLAFRQPQPASRAARRCSSGRRRQFSQARSAKSRPRSLSR